MSHTIPPTPRTRAARVALYQQHAAAAAMRWFDANGRWRSERELPLSPRERLWLCCALFAAGHDRLANAIISATQYPIWHSAEDGGDYTFDIFHTNIAIFLLAKYRDRLSPSASKPLLALAREGMEFYHGDRRPDFQFQGFNDNMPAKATMGLILGGELLGHAAAVEYGVWNLRRLAEMLRRRGSNGEWNSPTYTPLTVHAMAEIAAHADSREARQLARKIEARLWLDLAARFHPELGVLAGPYVRAYAADELAQLSNMSAMLWFVLGDRSRVSPLALFDDRQRDQLVLHHEGDVAFNVSQMCWFASENYHVPPLALRLLHEKSWPFRAVTTAEMGDWGADYPARAIRLETWLQQDYAVGTASSVWLTGGQTHPYHVIYRQGGPDAPVGTIFYKMLADGGVPGESLSAVDSLGAPYPAAGERYLTSQANTLTLQDGPTVLMLTNPCPGLGGLAGRVPERPVVNLAPVPVSSLCEMVLFPSHFRGADEIIVGDRQRAKWAGGVAHGEWIGVRRGRLLMAVRSLAFTADGQPKITLEKINRYEVIKTEFYRGAPRIFTPQELRATFGGFVAEHASVDEFPSLSAFVASLSAARFSDYYWIMRRTRYRRPAFTGRAALELEISASPGAVLPRYATINGDLAPEPRLAIDGVADRDVPFFNEPWRSAPEFFPWEKFNLMWGKGWTGDRGI